MGSKKRTLLILLFTTILIITFFFQKKLIDKFSMEPERLELKFKINDEVISFILAEEEYIVEKYSLGYEEYVDEEIIMVSIQKLNNIEDEFFKDRFVDYIKLKIPQLEQEQLNMIDYSNTIRILKAWYDGTKLLLACQLFILTMIILTKRIKIINKYVKKDLIRYYPEEIIKVRTNAILEDVIRLSLLIFIGIFLLRWIINLQFNIPGNYLPANNIFDFNFYRSISNVRKTNLSNYGNLYYNILNKVRLFTLGSCILSSITFLLIIKKPNYKVMEGRDKYGKSSV